MKRGSVAVKHSSPGRGALSALAALACVLLICAPVGAQKSARRGKPPRTSKLPKSLAAAQGEGRPGILTSHIPPIIMEDGSLTIETGRFDESDQSGGAHHRYKYKRRNFAKMSKVAVGVITDDGIARYYDPYDVSAGKWEVHIWLEKQMNDDPESPVYVPVNDAPDPQIIVKDSHEIEIDKDTFNDAKCDNTYNPRRPCRYKHEPYEGKHFRIAKLAIRKGNQSMPPPVLPAKRQKVFVMIYYCRPGYQCPEPSLLNRSR